MCIRDSRITIAPDKQDPTEDKLETLIANLSKNILDIGEKAEITAKGTTNLGYEKLFDPGDLNYISSNPNICLLYTSRCV